MKNVFDGLISRRDMAKKGISELAGILTKSLKTEKQREQRLEITEQNIQGLWDDYERCNINVMGIWEKEERKKQNSWNNNNWNFFQLRSDTKPWREEAQKTSSRIYAKKPTHRHMIFKRQKIKDNKKKILKEARGQNILLIQVQR